MVNSTVNAIWGATVSGIVRPAPKVVGTPTQIGLGPRIPFPRVQQWAPAWFYSALNWLGKTYYDANNVAQIFSSYMAGSDVDPYEHIGSTRLFLIVRIGEGFRLSVAPDANSIAPASQGSTYPVTDEGIREMYLSLANQPVFASLKYCYIPGRIGLESDPRGAEGGFGSGYDPATGLRAIVLGSAVSQVVPLDDFIKIYNEQIYNPNPVIVPIVNALVYDLARHNTIGATTFTLPTFYARDRVSAGTEYVNKLSQTVLFGGGPGYNDAAATALNLILTTQVASGGHLFTTYDFDKAKVTTTEKVGTRVETGIAELTYNSTSPSSVFAHQHFLGFYRDNAWTNTLGVPIWDYGTDNGGFTATTAAVIQPENIYDPTHGFLSGGSLQNVVRQLRQASYLYSWDVLVGMLNNATTDEVDRGVAIATTAAALDFNLKSNAANAPILDQLQVPIVATVTTTPNNAAIRPLPGERTMLTVANNGIGRLEQIIGAGGNAPDPTRQGPVTAQVGLTASIPREALDGTGINSIEIGTAFPEQSLGAGASFKALASGMTVNLMERHDVDPPLPPYNLQITNLDVKFHPGTSYVLTATGKTLTVRGSDGSTSTASVEAHDATHTFVGAMVYDASITTVRLFPKLTLSLAAPPVGTYGVQLRISGPGNSASTMPARASPTPLMLTNKSRLADSSRSLPIVSAMAWSTALSWEAKCWIVVSASDSAKSSAMPLPRRFFHSVRPATVPARIV